MLVGTNYQTPANLGTTLTTYKNRKAGTSGATEVPFPRKVGDLSSVVHSGSFLGTLGSGKQTQSAQFRSQRSDFNTPMPISNRTGDWPSD